MLVTLSGIVTLVKLPQPWKAKPPMLVTLSGIVMLVKLLQLRKASDGIFVTPFGIVMDVASLLFIYNCLLLAP